MEIRYNRIADKKFMILSGLKEDVLLFEIEMMEQNKLKHLLPMSLVISNGLPELWYNITHLLPLEQWLRFKKVGAELLNHMLEEVVQSNLEVSEYLLCTQSLSFHASQIFVDMENNQHYFCYLPGQHVSTKGERSSMIGLLESMLSMIDFQNKDLMNRIYHMLELMQQTDGSYLSLQYCLQKEKEKKERQFRPISIEESEPIIDKEKGIKSLMEKEKNKILGELVNQWKKWTDWSLELKAPIFSKKPKLKTKKGKANPILIEDESMDLTQTIIDFDQEFGVVGELVYLGEDGYPAIEVGNEKITIGNNEQIADVVIADSTISKIHALIEYIGGEYFLEDLNSVYGTFINGERLGYRERRKLFAQDVVHFAQAKYRFH